MKLDVSLSYVIKRLALLSLLILITSSLYADFTLIYFAAVAAESLITAFAHKHNKKTVLTPFIFNAVYLILFFYFISGGTPYQGMFLLEGTEPFIDFVRYNMTGENSTGLITNLAAFLLPAVGLTMLDMQIQKAMYTEEACKISRDEIHRRKVTFYTVQLLLLLYSLIFQSLFSILLFAAFVYCLVNIIYFLSADSSVKLLRKSDYPDNRICKSLIVTADIKSFAYIPQLLPSAFLTGCPKLRKALRHNRITEQNGCIVLKYGRYLDHKYNADKITKKSLLVYCSTLKMFKGNFSEQLSDIFDEYISKEFKVYLLVTEKCSVKCKKQYDKLKEILGDKVIFLDARDMEQGESLEQYLGVSTTVRPSAPRLIETEPSRNEENYNTQISIYRRRSKSDIKNIKRYYITPFLLGASPLAILVIQKLLSSLAERKNSPCYTAVKRFYEKDRLVILWTMCFINIIIVLTLFGPMDVLPVFYLLCVNPILYIAAVSLYIRIYVEILRSGDMGQIHQKRLLINGDMGDLLNCSWLFPKSYKNEAAEFEMQNGSMDNNAKYDTFILSYERFVQYEKQLDAVSEKIMLIHAEFEPSYYGLESEDLKHIADDLFKRGIQLYIHTDHADSCPNDGAFVLLKGNYSDSIRSVMLSGDNLSDDIYQMMNLYAERLSDAAVRSMSYSNREHKMLISQLERLKDHHSLLEVFYALMQAAELFFHYTALCILTEENSVRQMPKELSLGTMMNIISEKAGRFSPQLYNIKENRRNEFDSVIRDYTEASKFFRSTINLKLSSKQFTGRHAAELTVQIRNRYLGHGTLTYSISEEFLAAFIPMVSAAIAECINMSSALSSSGILSITNLANTYIPAAAERDDSIYLFSRTFTDSVGAEYIDPVSGSFYRTAEPERVSLLWNENVLKKFGREAE